MKIKVSLFIVALLIVVGMQMVSANTGYPVDTGYPIVDTTKCEELFFVGEPMDCDAYYETYPELLCRDYPEKCEEPKLPPPAQPVTPAKKVVENTPAINQVNRIMATNQLLRANQIRRPLVIPVRNVLDNLFRFELVK